MNDHDPVMYVPRMDAFLNRWFTSYDEARASLDAQGGYLLPYRDHYSVSTTDAIRELGLDPGDPDWAAIGWDWVRPVDPAHAADFGRIVAHAFDLTDNTAALLARLAGRPG